MMNTSSIPVRGNGSTLGELLMAAHMITAERLRETLTISRKAVFPLGRVLLMAGYVTEPELTAALKIQSMLRGDAIAASTAIRGLRMLRGSSVSLERALEILGHDPSKVMAQNPKKRANLLRRKTFYNPWKSRRKALAQA